MMTLVTCVTAACDECGDHPDMDDINPHFDTAHDAIKWLRETGWRVFQAGLMVCPDCSARHDCVVYGHNWTHWRQCWCAGRIPRHGGTADTPCPQTYRTCDRCSHGEVHDTDTDF